MNIIRKISNKISKYLFILSFLVVILLISMIYTDTMSFSKSPRELIKPYDFTGDVDIILQDGTVYQDKVPFILETDQSFDVVLHLEDIGMIDDKTLSFISKDILVRCEIDDTVIYRSSYVHNDSMFDDGNVLYMVDLPETVNSNLITLHYYNDKEYKTKFELKELKIGKRINIISYYFLNETLFNLFIIVFLFIITIGILLTGNFLKKGLNNMESYFNNIAILCMVIIFYITSLSPISYYILHKYNVFLHILSYTSIMIIPLILMKAVMYRTDKKTHLFLQIGIILSSVNILYQYSMVYFRLNTFSMMTNYSYYSMLYSLLAISYSFAKSENNTDNKLYTMIISLLPLMLSLLIELTVGMNENRIIFSSPLQFSILIFSLLQSREFISLYIDYRDKKIQSDTYKKLALIDNLTGIGNRMAFSEQKGFYSKANSSFFIIVLDIDNLKYVNDTYGHKYGDEIIKLLPNILNEVFSDDYPLDIYRVGGDEFFVICHAPDSYDLDSKLSDFVDKYENYDLGMKENKYSVSYGFDYYNRANNDFDEILHHADQNMYRLKSQKKADRKKA